MPLYCPQTLAQAPSTYCRLGNARLARSTCRRKSGRSRSRESCDLPPAGHFKTLSVDNKYLHVLPKFFNLLELVGYVDASHAIDLRTRRSVTGLSFCLAGGGIAFKSKFQPTVATISTASVFRAQVPGNDFAESSSRCRAGQESRKADPASASRYYIRRGGRRYTERVRQALDL
jgi:hypothetical protein